MPSQHRDHLAAADAEAGLQRRSPTSGADNRGAHSSPSFASSCCCAGRLDLFGRELLAVDGTRIKAVNNKDRNFTRNSLAKFIRAADERLDEYSSSGSTRAMSAEEDGMGGGARGRTIWLEKIAALTEKRRRYAAILRGIGAKRRDSDVANRSRQPGDGRAYEGLKASATTFKWRSTRRTS